MKMKSSQRIHARRAALESATQSQKINRLDIVLQRLAHVTQVGLLALGVFGYYYTVLPVFQNQQLQEQAAKLELEKATAQQQLDELVQQQAKVSAEIVELRDSFARERVRNTSLAGQVTTSRQEEVSARRRSEEAEAELASQLKTLDAARWELVTLDFSFAHATSSLRVMSAEWSSDSKREMPQQILENARTWPNPYEDLLSAVTSAQKKGEAASGIPSRYYEELRSAIEAQKSTLRCTAPDFQALRASYELQLAVLISTIEGDTTKALEKLQEEYAAKGERVRIADEYRQATRRRITFEKTFTLDNEFRDRVRALRKECSDKADAMISDFRKSKGAKH